MVRQNQKAKTVVDVEAPQELMAYIEELQDDIKQNLRSLEEENPGCIRQMNNQFGGTEIDNLLISKGLGFDQGYNDCRERRLLRWIHMAIISAEYLRYESNLNGENSVNWPDLNRDFIHGLSIWDDYLEDMLEEISVPDKDAFLQGWCEGVHHFFMSVCGLIECPPDFLPGKIAV